MRISFGWSVGIIVLLALSGAAAGYFTAPRYRAPAQGGEARLRERAAAYYRAIQVKDFQVVTGMYTPARQRAETAELKKTIREQQRMFASFKPETQEQFRQGSETIRADKVDVQLAGDWAVTNATITTYPYPDDPDKGVEIPIGAVVWVRTGGDWWVYKRKNPELLAYGNPPDFALNVLKKEGQGDMEITSMDFEAPPGEESPAAEPEGGEAEGGPPPADNQDEGTADE